MKGSGDATRGSSDAGTARQLRDVTNEEPGTSEASSTQPSCKRLLLKVQHAMGRGPQGQHFWHSKFKKGFVEVKTEGAKSCQVATSSKAVEDYELTWGENISLNIIQGCQQLFVRLVSGEKDKPGPSVGSCGIRLDQVASQEAPVDKYFSLFRKTPNKGYKTGGYICLSLAIKADDEPEPEPSQHVEHLTSVPVLTSPSPPPPPCDSAAHNHSTSCSSEEELNTSSPLASIPLVCSGSFVASSVSDSEGLARDQPQAPWSHPRRSSRPGFRTSYGNYPGISSDDVPMAKGVGEMATSVRVWTSVATVGQSTDANDNFEKHDNDHNNEDNCYDNMYNGDNDAHRARGNDFSLTSNADTVHDGHILVGSEGETKKTAMLTIVSQRRTVDEGNQGSDNSDGLSLRRSSTVPSLSLRMVARDIVDGMEAIRMASGPQKDIQIEGTLPELTPRWEATITNTTSGTELQHLATDGSSELYAPSPGQQYSTDDGISSGVHTSATNKEVVVVARGKFRLLLVLAAAAIGGVAAFAICICRDGTHESVHNERRKAHAAQHSRGVQHVCLSQ